jgi:hypothetical protein
VIVVRLREGETVSSIAPVVEAANGSADEPDEPEVPTGPED